MAPAGRIREARVPASLVSRLRLTHSHNSGAARQLLPVKRDQRVCQLIRQGDVYSIAAADSMLAGDHCGPLCDGLGNRDQLDHLRVGELLVRDRAVARGARISRSLSWIAGYRYNGSHQTLGAVVAPVGRLHDTGETRCLRSSQRALTSVQCD